MADMRVRHEEEGPGCQGRSDRYPGHTAEVHNLLQGLMKTKIPISFVCHRKERPIHMCVPAFPQDKCQPCSENKSYTHFPNDQEPFIIMFSNTLTSLTTSENLDLS